MTTAYDPVEIDRLVSEARSEIQRRQTAPRCDSCGGLIMHRSEHWLSAMADQLEAARDRIKQHEQAADEDRRALNQIKADREEWRKAYHAANAEIDRLQRELAQARHG